MLCQKNNYHVSKDFDTMIFMMMKMKLLLICGIVVITLPILGLTRNIKNILFFIAGLIIIVMTFSIKKSIRILRIRLKRAENQEGTVVQ